MSVKNPNKAWDKIDSVIDTTAYALEITGDTMLPVYREGDTIIVSPKAKVRKGRPRGGENHRW